MYYKTVIAKRNDEAICQLLTNTVDASDTFLNKVKSFIPLLQSYGIYSAYGGNTDVDIDLLKRFEVPLVGNKSNNQRYFEFHHNASDTFEQVNFREMQLNTTVLSALMYLLYKNPSQ